MTTSTQDQPVSHTLGPWELGTINPTIIKTASGHSVAKAYTNGKISNPNEFSANARLIAAAPDLLSALKLWMQYEDSAANDEDHVIPMLNYAAALEATKAAIAKAEGGAP